MTKPPFKLAVAGLFLDGATHTAKDVTHILEPEYPGKSFFSLKQVETVLQGLCAVGILVSEPQEDMICYSITAAGRKKTESALS